MTVYRKNPGDGLLALFRNLTRGRRLTRGAAFGGMILGALLAFEIFNFSTTQFALLGTATGGSPPHESHRMSAFLPTVARGKQ